MSWVWFHSLIKDCFLLIQYRQHSRNAANVSEDLQLWKYTKAGITEITKNNLQDKVQIKSGKMCDFDQTSSLLYSWMWSYMEIKLEVLNISFMLYKIKNDKKKKRWSKVDQRWCLIVFKIFPRLTAMGNSEPTLSKSWRHKDVQ